MVILLPLLAACLTAPADDPAARAERQLQQLESLGYVGGEAVDEAPPAAPATAPAPCAEGGALPCYTE